MGVGLPALNRGYRREAVRVHAEDGAVRRLRRLAVPASVRDRSTGRSLPHGVRDLDVVADLRIEVRDGLEAGGRQGGVLRVGALRAGREVLDPFAAEVGVVVVQPRGRVVGGFAGASVVGRKAVVGLVEGPTSVWISGFPPVSKKPG